MGRLPGRDVALATTATTAAAPAAPGHGSQPYQAPGHDGAQRMVSGPFSTSGDRRATGSPALQGDQP